MLMLLFYLSLIEDKEDIITFERIFDKYKEPMHRVAMKILNDHHLAEDAVQIALWGIARNIKSVPTNSEPELIAYVIVAAKNAARNILKKRKEYDEVLSIYELEFAADDDVFQKIVEDQDYHNLLNLIMSLPTVYREVLMMRFVMELTPKEIGEVTGNKAATVSQQIFRGKKMLEQAYQRKGAGYDEA